MAIMPCSKIYRLFFLVLHGIYLCILAGCGTPPTNVELGNKTGVLHWGNGTEPQSLDPHIATGVPEHHIISSLMEGLVLKDSRTLEPTPGIAERWDISEDQ
jgi:oligopeptide transport system substrate-binding protein